MCISSFCHNVTKCPAEVPYGGKFILTHSCWALGWLVWGSHAEPLFWVIYLVEYQEAEGPELRVGATTYKCPPHLVTVFPLPVSSPKDSSAPSASTKG